jgi:hypothetical protein
VPELEFWKPAYEGFEFLVGFGREGGGAIFHVRVAFERGVKLRADEGEEEVEEVDAEGVGDCEGEKD